MIDDDTATVTIEAAPAIQIDKSAGGIDDGDGNGVDAGDTITYTIVVTNTGNLPLDPIAVDDALIGGAVPCGGLLAVGEARTCDAATLTLTVDQLGTTVTNTATATGTPPAGDPVTDDDTADVVVPAAPGLTLDKLAGFIDVDANGASAGDIITYDLVVYNSGNVPIDGVVVNDPMFSDQYPGGNIPCGSGPIDIGGSSRLHGAPAHPH